MSVDNNQSIRDVLTPESYMGKGMAWPPQEDPETGDFAKAEAEKSISDCLLHLLTTSLGEISPLVLYGTRIDELLFSNGDNAFIQDIIASTRRAIEQFEQRVTVLDILYQLKDVTPGSRSIEISIRYRIVETGKVETFIYTLPPLGVSA